VPMGSEHVILVWKSDYDLVKASELISFGKLIRIVFDSYVECWVEAGTAARREVPHAGIRNPLSSVTHAYVRDMSG
jgi:hypothetical protein